MNRKLDLTTIQRPTFELTLLDAEHTTIQVKTPSVNQFREMQKVAAQLEHAEETGQDSVDLIYAFLAQVLSCNREALSITDAELRGKYNVDLDTALLIYREYIGFLNDAITAKN